jgi:hypothetical protein
MYGYEWSFRYLRHSMNLLQRLDIIVLALVLAHIVVVVTRVSYSFRIARRAEAIDTPAEHFSAIAGNWSPTSASKWAL